MNEEREKKRLRFFAAVSAIAAALLFFSAWLLEESAMKKSDLNEAARIAEEKLHELESAAIEISDSALSIIERPALLKFFAGKNLSPLGITVLLYNDAELSAWSGCDATFASMEKLLTSASSLVHLPNGWYEMRVRERNHRTVVAFILIFSDYAYQNKYLVNEFNSALGIPHGIEFSDSETGIPVRSFDGNTLFKITSSENYLTPEEKFPFAELLDVAALLLLLATTVLGGRLVLYGSVRFATAIIAAIFATRIATLYLRIPEALYETSLFSPAYYASSFLFGSLGDLFLNVGFALAAALIFYRHPRLEKVFSLSITSRTRNVLLHTLCILLVISASVAVNYYTSGLILNSKLSFSHPNIFELNGFSVLGFVIIFLLMGFYFLIIKISAQLIRHSPFAADYKTRYLVFSAGITLLALLISVRDDAGATAFFTVPDFIVLILLSALAEIFFIREKFSRFQSTVFMLLIFSCYASCLMLIFNDRKEDENLKLIARKMESEKDPVAEHLFDDVQSRIRSDTVMDRLSVAGRSDLIAQRLQQVYFSGYWSRFDARVYCFDASGNPLPYSSDSYSADYFEKIITASGKPTLSENLFYTGSSGNTFSYIVRITPGNSATSLVLIFVLLTEKFLQEEAGLPELFISGKSLPGRMTENFSFARYSNGKLISGLGKYSYPLASTAFESPVSGYSAIREDAFEHLVYNSANGSMVVLTRPRRTWLEAVTLFSYITLLFSLLLVVISAFAQLFGHNFFVSSSLKQRIRIAAMLLVAASFILTGWATIRFIAGKYENELNENISAKISNVLSAMNAEIPGPYLLENILSDEKTSLLLRLSSTLSADFNIYTLNGRLIFSSQPKLYQQGIISDRMNPEALFELSVRGKTKFTHSESIGRLGYIAAYQPLRNRNNESEGYIGLPHFGKQAELKKQISSFIGSLMNLYILLLGLALTAAYFISSRITQPLQQLREKFSIIRLGKHSEKIEWRSKDEIGALVNEYNRMVDELAANAEMLARSERETAWREMAKQVAHEIKNPLTPMKLSIQHLQRAIREDSPEVISLTEKISHTLLEQIDALSSIASAFSSFAKMPLAKKEKVNIEEIILSIINLYKETSAVRISYAFQLHEPCIVLADKEELLRMFGNIIKNSIQSIPETREGRVEINIQRETNRCIVSITDNGSGISEEIIPKIFSPNFTTKTTGMGLGLAMARSIAESSGGRIWFETKKQSGTTFFIELPLLPESS